MARADILAIERPQPKDSAEFGVDSPQIFQEHATPPVAVEEEGIGHLRHWVVAVYREEKTTSSFTIRDY